MKIYICNTNNDCECTLGRCTLTFIEHCTLMWLGGMIALNKGLLVKLVVVFYLLTLESNYYYFYD